MTETQQLEEFFKNGTFVHPTTSERLSSVNVLRALRYLCTTTQASLSTDVKTQRALEIIGDVDHVVLILLDAFGMHLVKQLPDSNFLKSHLVEPITGFILLTSLFHLTDPLHLHFLA